MNVGSTIGRYQHFKMAPGSHVVFDMGNRRCPTMCSAVTARLSLVPIFLIGFVISEINGIYVFLALTLEIACSRQF